MSKANPRSFRFAIEPAVTGTATAGGASTITLAAAAFAANDEPNQRWIVITAGTGAGQAPRRIIDFVVGTLVATVEPAWGTNPDATSVYAIFEALTSDPFDGLAQAGAAQTITLGDRESTKDDYYTGLMIETMSGTGGPPAPKQVRRIIDYVGSTRVATVNAPWGTNPDAATRYRVQGHLYFPVGHLEAYCEGGQVLRVAYQPGAIARGQYSLTSKVEHADSYGDIHYMEVVVDAGGGADVLTVYRAENAGGDR